MGLKLGREQRPQHEQARRVAARHVRRGHRLVVGERRFEARRGWGGQPMALTQVGALPLVLLINPAHMAPGGLASSLQYLGDTY